MRPGTTVRCVMSKWGDRPHWVFEGTFLGRDAHGEWIGFPAGTRFTRPGADFTAPNDQVGLVPAEADGVRPGFLATFHAPGGVPWPALGGAPVATYVDMTTPPVWEDAVLTAVDLDLDVLRGMNDRVIVDDEDEFAEHQVAFGYPVEVIALAEAARDGVRAAMLSGRAPFDGEAHLTWLDRLAAS
ncbi:MAG: DUF402 domain-containing protein [Nocardioides sp.]